jgi:flagellar biosynthesis chaperone FliJ
MAKFVFKLEAVLEQRRARESQRQSAVARIERERVEAEEEIRAFQRAIERERDELRLMLGSREPGMPDVIAGGLGGSEFQVDAGPAMIDLRGARQQASATLRSVARAQQAVLKLAGIHRRLDAARLELLKAATDRKAAELLREKQYRAWLAEQNRKDAAMVDEIAVTRFGREGDDEDSSGSSSDRFTLGEDHDGMRDDPDTEAAA